jgi:hypothetical protein
MLRSLLLLGVFALAALAHAHPPEGKPQPAKADSGASAGASAAQSGSVLSEEDEQLFRELDLDGDGHVSKAEAAGYEEVVLGFDRADRNKDGKLTPAEFKRLMSQQRTARR